MLRRLLKLASVMGMMGLGGYAYLRRRSRPVLDHPFLNLRKPLVIAHRGGQGLWPPNTCYAFERARELGVDVLEMDIHMTADGAIVARHDGTVDATTDGLGAIKDLGLERIKSLDAGYTWSADGGRSYPFRGRGITIPTLDEVLEAFPDIRLNIDIKPSEAEVVPVFAKLLRDYDRLDDVLVASFHDSQLRRYRRLNPQSATAAGVIETGIFYGLTGIRLAEIFQPAAEAFQPPEVDRRRRVVTEKFVKNAHRHNMEVHVWTVNEIGDMQRLLNWGVDGIITDFPDRMLKLLRR
jgi:glycerophosphoryl diester phosphodiesterase